MIVGTRKIIFLYSILILFISGLPLRSLHIQPVPLIGDQCSDNVVVVSHVRYCRVDSLAIVGYCSSVQDATATHRSPHVPLPPESSHRNESMVSERNQSGNEYKKGRAVFRSGYQFVHTLFADNRQHAPPSKPHSSIPQHLKSTILQI